MITKKAFRVIAILLVISIVTGVTAFAESGYAYDEGTLAAFTPEWAKIQADETVISLTPGGEVGEMRFAWLSAEDDTDDAVVGTTYRTDSDEIIDTFEIEDNKTEFRLPVFSVIVSMLRTLFAMI